MSIDPNPIVLRVAEHQPSRIHRLGDGLFLFSDGGYNPALDHAELPAGREMNWKGNP